MIVRVPDLRAQSQHRACGDTQQSKTGTRNLSRDREDYVKTTTVETAERGRSPLGAHIRFLMDGPHGKSIWM